MSLVTEQSSVSAIDMAELTLSIDSVPSWYAARLVPRAVHNDSS